MQIICHRIAFLLCMVVPMIAHAQVWEDIGGPSGDVLLSATITHDGDIYLLSHNLHHSTDNGATWTRRSIASPSLDYYPRKLVRTRSGALFLTNNYRLQRSLDSGKSWTVVRSLPDFPDLAISPAGHIIVCGDDSVRVSTDEGVTWRSTRKSAMHVFADSTNTFYAFTADLQLKRSIDTGRTWTHVTGLPYANQPIMVFAANKQRTIATLGSEVFLTTDNGESWRPVFDAGNNISNMCSLSADTLFLSSTHKVFRSTDAGDSWTLFETVGPNTRIVGGYIAGRQLVVLRADQLLKYHIDHKRWNKPFIPHGNMTGLVVAPSGSLYAKTSGVGGIGTDLWQYRDSKWSIRTEGASISDLAIDSAGVFYSSFNGSLQTSTDSGATWNSEKLLITTVQDIALTSKNVFVVQTNSKGLLRSTDRGNTWETNFSGMHTAVATSGPNVYLDGFFRSTDHGESWEEVASFPLITGSGTIRSIDANRSHVVLAADLTGVYFSTDWGTMWQNHSEGLPRTTIWQVIETPEGTTFAATDSGLFEYSPTTRTWKSVTEGFATVLSLALGKDGKVYASTAGSGVWRTKKTYGFWTSDVAKQARVEHAARIYPNPASKEVTIRSGSDKFQKCKIAIYNLLGEVLLTQTAENPDALTIDVSSMHAGQYFLRVSSDEGVQTLPLSIVK